MKPRKIEPNKNGEQVAVAPRDSFSAKLYDIATSSNGEIALQTEG
jgi:hypothetical protein